MPRTAFSFHPTRSWAPWLLLALSLAWLPQARADAARAAPSAVPSVQRQLQDHLFDAARTGSLPMLQEFVAAGYDLNTRDAHGYTPIILAAYHGQLPAVQLLIDAGADPCAEDNRGNTALMGAIFKAEIQVARLLMQAKCNPNHRNAAGQTVAMYAALFGRVEVLAGLKAQGADLGAADADGNTVARLQSGEINVAAPQRKAGVPK